MTPEREALLAEITVEVAVKELAKALHKESCGAPCPFTAGQALTWKALRLIEDAVREKNQRTM